MAEDGDSRTERARRRHALLWGGQQRGSRGPKPGLQLTDIVRVGIQIADAEGLAALSMNRLAKEMGSGVMTLYRYLPGKDELVDLMADTVVGETAYPPEGRFDGWRHRLAFTARAEWARYRQHPWMLDVMVSTTLPMGPGTTAEVEWSIQAVGELELSAAHRLWVVMTVSAFVQGAALLMINDDAAGDNTAAGFDGVSQIDVEESLNSLGATAMMQLTSELTGPPDLDAWFEFGLQRTLDGVAQFVEDPDRGSTG